MPFVFSYFLEKEDLLGGTVNSGTNHDLPDSPVIDDARRWQGETASHQEFVVVGKLHQVHSLSMEAFNYHIAFK